MTDLRSPAGGHGTYNATYTISGLSQPARLLLLRNKAVIELGNAAETHTVHWQYHTITQGDSGNLFNYTAYPPQTLEVLDKTLADTLIARLHQSKGRVASRRTRIVMVLLATIVALVSIVYFLVLPWMAAAVASRVPISYERQLGDRVYAAMKPQFQVDEMRSAYTTAFFDALKVPTRYPVKITVVKSDIANAFALPGGHIVIHDKLLNRLTAYPQLAALLAHEFVHIENRHSLKSLFRQASATLLFAMLIGDAGALGNVVLSGADNLRSLSYSRSLESEADADGLALLTARNIDGAGFVQLFQILQTEPEAPGPEWISSHPQLKTRIRNVQQHTAFQQQQPRTDSTLHHLFLKIKTAD